MVQHVSVHLVCLEIHSRAVFVQLISAREVTRVRTAKCAFLDVANIDVKMWFAELVQHATNQVENVFVNPTLWAIQTFCACHVRINICYNCNFRKESREL